MNFAAAEPFREFLRFLARPLVEPGGAGPERVAGGVELAERLALVGDGERGDTAGVDLAGEFG